MTSIFDRGRVRRSELEVGAELDWLCFALHAAVSAGRPDRYVIYLLTFQDLHYTCITPRSSTDCARLAAGRPYMHICDTVCSMFFMDVSPPTGLTGDLR